MKQSKLASWIDTLGGTAFGFVCALVLQYAVCWWYALPLRVADNLGIIGLFTVVSLVRGYAWRRFMESMRVVPALSPAVIAIAAERQRQIDVKGYTIEHDDEYAAGVLARAGAAYALGDHAETAKIKAGDEVIGQITFRTAQVYPWKGGLPARDFRTRMATAGAFMAAEIERHDRERKRAGK